MTTMQETMARVGPTVDFNGRRLTLGVWNISDFAAARSHLRSVLPDPLVGIGEAVAGLPVAIAEKLAMQAYEDRKRLGDLDSKDAREYFGTPAGIAFWIWRAMLKADANIAYEEVAAWITQEHRNNAAGVFQLMTDLQDLAGLSDRSVKDLEGNSPRSSARPRRPRTRK